jgi:hypothetical protein
LPENTTRYGETYPKSDLFNKALSRYVSSLRHAHTGKRRYQSYCQNLFSSLFLPELN